MSIGENIKHVVELKNQAAEKSGRSGDAVSYTHLAKIQIGRKREYKPGLQRESKPKEKRG